MIKHGVTTTFLSFKIDDKNQPNFAGSLFALSPWLNKRNQDC
jgi:hypothetical protein